MSRVALALALWISPAGAWAEALSMDLELQQPRFGSASLTGLDHPEAHARRLEAGVVGLYLRDPLVLLVDERETGAIVAQRHTAVLGLAYDVSRAFSLRGSLPLAWQWGSEEPRLAADGFGLADPSVGLRWTAVQGEPWRAALRLDALLPLGSQERYLGEGAPRLALGVVPALDWDRVGMHADLGVLLRAPVETGSDLVLGHESSAGLALRYSPAPGVQDLFAGAVSRWALLPAAGTLPSTELLLGSRLYPRPGLVLDLGVGRGLGPGYGTSEFRAWLGVRVRWDDLGVRSPEPLLDFAWTEPASPAPEQAPSAEPLAWEEGQLAQVHRARIEIRDPIQFAYDTDEILPASLPTLLAVAELLEETPWILHVVIEGHASAEGEHAYNYALSNTRAGAIVRALVEAGVHPRRLSSRGMGEVRPVQEGVDEASLAVNRRVLFLIAEQLDPLDPLPPAEAHVVPWGTEEGS